MLTDEQRAELEALGAENVRIKVIQGGISAAISGFNSGTLMRGDVDDWLTQQNAKEAADQKSTLRWAMIAGWAAVASVIVGIIGVAATIWLAK